MIRKNVKRIAFPPTRFRRNVKGSKLINRKGPLLRHLGKKALFSWKVHGGEQRGEELCFRRSMASIEEGVAISVHHDRSIEGGECGGVARSIPAV